MQLMVLSFLEFTHKKLYCPGAQKYLDQNPGSIPVRHVPLGMVLNVSEPQLLHL